MWQYVIESGVWSVGGLILGYLVGGQVNEIKMRLKHIERLEEERKERS
jgi:hypothetical protein